MDNTNSPIKFTYCNHCKTPYSYPDNAYTAVNKDKRYCPMCNMNGDGNEKPRNEQ